MEEESEAKQKAQAKTKAIWYLLFAINDSICSITSYKNTIMKMKFT